MKKVILLITLTITYFIGNSQEDNQYFSLIQNNEELGGFPMLGPTDQPRSMCARPQKTGEPRSWQRQRRCRGRAVNAR